MPDPQINVFPDPDPPGTGGDGLSGKAMSWLTLTGWVRAWLGRWID